MKKLAMAMLALLMVAGCSSAEVKKDEKEAETDVKDDAEKVEDDVTGDVTKTAEVKGDGETTTATIVEKDGKIKKITIDQVKDDGTDKREAGADYGMKKASSIGKEWDEQIEYLEQFIEKNGIDAVKLDKDGYAEDEDLKSGCTMKLTEIMQAVKDAQAK